MGDQRLAVVAVSSSMLSCRIHSCCSTCWNRAHSADHTRFSLVPSKFVVTGVMSTEAPTTDAFFAAVRLILAAKTKKTITFWSNLMSSHLRQPRGVINVADIGHVLTDGRRYLSQVAPQLLRGSSLFLEQNNFLALSKVVRVSWGATISLVSQILHIKCRHFLCQNSFFGEEIAWETTNLEV